MAQVVKLKRTAVSGKVPSSSNLELGELAINTYDGRIFFEKDSGTPSIEQVVTTNSQTTGSINVNGNVTASYFFGDGSGLSNISTDIGEVATVTSSFDNLSTINVGHNFNSKNVIVSVYDNNDSQIIPQTVSLTDQDTVQVVLSSAQSGFVVVAKGGHVVSGSADDASNLNGQNASYYLDYNNFTNIPDGLISGSSQLDGTTIGATSEIEASGSFSGSFVGSIQGPINGSESIDVSSYTLDDSVTYDLDGVAQRGKLSGLKERPSNTSVGGTTYYYTTHTLTFSADISSVLKKGDIITYTPSRNSTATESHTIIDVGTTTAVINKPGDTGGNGFAIYTPNNLNTFTINRPITYVTDNIVIDSDIQFNSDSNFSGNSYFDGGVWITGSYANISPSKLLLDADEIVSTNTPDWNFSIVPKYGYAPGAPPLANSYNLNYVSLGSSTKAIRYSYINDLTVGTINVQSGSGTPGNVTIDNNLNVGGNISGSSFNGTGILSSSNETFSEFSSSVASDFSGLSTDYNNLQNIPSGIVSGSGTTNHIAFYNSENGLTSHDYLKVNPNFNLFLYDSVSYSDAIRIEMTGSLSILGGISAIEQNSTFSNAYFDDIQVSSIHGSTYTGDGSNLTFGGTGLISGSSQISELGYVSTGSNTFQGDQDITGYVSITRSKQQLRLVDSDNSRQYNFHVNEDAFYINEQGTSGKIFRIVTGSLDHSILVEQDGVTIGNDLLVNGNISGSSFNGTGLISGSDQITDLTTYKETVSGNSSYTITHNLNEQYPIVQAWNTGTSQQEVPSSITTNSVNQVTVVFSTTFAGVIIVKK